MEKKVFETWSSLINDKIVELKERLKYLKGDECNLTKNTKSMQLYKTNRDIKVLNLIKHLMNESTTLQSGDTEILTTLTTLASEHRISVVDFDEGDSFIDIAYNKYRDVKHISDKIEKVCEAKGLKLDIKTGIFVKA